MSCWGWGTRRWWNASPGEWTWCRDSLLWHYLHPCKRMKCIKSFKHTCGENLHSLWHYMVTVSCRYKEHWLNCAMKRKEWDKCTQQLVEHTWEICRWGWEVWTLPGSKWKRGIPMFCNFSWMYLWFSSLLCSWTTLKIEYIENVCLAPPVTVATLILS